MLQLWKLVLLCGLLTGTSASLLGNLDDDLSNAVNKLKPAVEKGLETIDDTLECESTRDDEWYLGTCLLNAMPALSEAATRGCS